MAVGLSESDLLFHRCASARVRGLCGRLLARTAVAPSWYCWLVGIVCIAHVLLWTCDLDDSACYMLLLLQVFFDVRERIVARIVLWSAGWRVMHMMPARALRVE